MIVSVRRNSFQTSLLLDAEFICGGGLYNVRTG
jgi:hypothetical protein